jgi:hypothetical protein
VSEGPGTVVAYTKGDAEFARRAGARVDLKLYEGVTAHAFPPDFAERFAGWVRFIRNDRGAVMDQGK